MLREMQPLGAMHMEYIPYKLFLAENCTCER